MNFSRNFRKYTGIQRNSKYVYQYLNDANVRSSLLMSLVVISLEAWMIIRQMVKYWIPRCQDGREVWGIVSYFQFTSYFWLLFFVALSLFFFCLTYLSKKMSPLKKWLLNLIPSSITFFYGFLVFGQVALPSFAKFGLVPQILLVMLYIVSSTFAACILVYSTLEMFKKKSFVAIAVAAIALFALICLVFGTFVSYTDLIKVEKNQAICFLTMVIYVACLLIWKPYISLSILGVIFFGFYYLVTSLNPDKVTFTEGDFVNFLTFFISLAMISVSIYVQRVSEGEKDEELEYIANYDDLTGLDSFQHFLNISHQISLENKDEQYYYIYVDIREFKVLNDQKGFATGNEYLRQFAKLLRKHFENCHITRANDDHFVIFTSYKDYEKRLEALREDVRIPFDGVSLDICCGIYELYDTKEEPRHSLDKARYICNFIKMDRNVFYKLYDDKALQVLRNMRFVSHNIDKAIQEGYIKVYYQPVVWSEDGNLCGVEALARWIDSEKGFMNPGQFVPALETMHLIHKLDICILEQVCRDLRIAIDNHRPIIPVSVNFSRLDFELMDPVAVLEEMTSKYQIPKDYLHVEITESALVGNIAVLDQTIKSLKEKGYAIWLDDFGSGYSSLNVLKDYSFDVLKIDMKFLSGFSSNPKAKSILRSIVDLASKISMRTLTEGVETDEEKEFLKEIGCERLQGYLFGKPMPKEELAAKIADGTYTVSTHLGIMTEGL